MTANIHALAAELGIPLASIRARGLVPYQEATLLEIAEIGKNGKTHLLTPGAAQAWRALKAAADIDGVQLAIVSAFRSIERQGELVRAKLAAGQSLEHILTILAPPGFSQHHSGRAVDLYSPGGPAIVEAFDSTPAFAWLCARAGAFGFSLSYPKGNAQGFIYEPWHWCYQAAEIDFNAVV